MIAMNRRAFLKVAAAGAAAVSGPRQTEGAERATRTQALHQPKGPSDVAVIGAGAFGGWTALYLRERGVNVTLIDQYGPGNARSSSGGETRQLRANYGDREIYTHWALEAFKRWRDREAEWGQTFFLQTGQVQLATEWTTALKETRKTFDRLNIAYEILRHDDVVRRYPQFDASGVDFAVFTPSTGVLRARESCLAVARSFTKKGGRLLEARAELGRRTDRRLLDVQLSGGDRITADRFVFACGPWLGKLFPDVLGKRLRTPRRVVFYYGTPPGDARFSYPNFPTWSMPGAYGFPSIDGKGFKSAPAIDDVVVDPDLQERVPTAEEVVRGRTFLARWFPALKDQPLLETRVCQYEYSVDSEFFVTLHPALHNVWLVGGGSGHGFKHGIMLGEYVARRALGDSTDPAWDAFFALKDKTF
jgi:glycine/D-amino acid oxidase-like deaminating enzyme